MYIKQYLEDNNISIYKVANSALVAYPTVFNIVNGKVDILNCALGVVKKIADALNLTIDELLTLWVVLGIRKALRYLQSEE